MKRLFRRIVLSAAALSPSVAFLAVQELAATLSFLILGVTGAVSVAVGITAVTPKVSQTLSGYASADTDYPSLLTQAALKVLREHLLDVTMARAQLANLMNATHDHAGVADKDHQVATILTHITAEWRVSDMSGMADDQVRELWLIDQLLRASPGQAGSLAAHFTAPNAMLAMRDRVADDGIA